MKKLVIFTLAMVLLSSMAFAFVDNNDENAIAALGAQAASTGGENTAIDAQGNPVAVKGSNAATNGATIDNSKTDLKFSNEQSNMFNDNKTYNIVDNAVLANVNVAGLAFQPGLEQEGRIDFRKTQSAEIDGSFNHATGVNNVNSAAGNMNSQKAFTTISIGKVGF